MIGPITFTVLGPPVPKARPRVVHGGRRGGRAHTYTPQKTHTYEHQVAVAAVRAGVRLFPGPVSLFIDFYLPTRRRLDLDNLLKTVMDALNCVAYADDSQVEEVFAVKHYDRQLPRAEIAIGLIDEARQVKMPKPEELCESCGKRPWVGLATDETRLCLDCLKEDKR